MSMLFELPIVTKREIARAYTPQAKTPEAAMRTLRGKHAVSDGIETLVRSSSGRLGGSLHVYCAINRDAARAVRFKQLELAHSLAKRAARIERSAAMRRMVKHLADVGSGTTYSELAAALSRPEVVSDLAVLNKQITAARRNALPQLGTTLMHGRVAHLVDRTAILSFVEGDVPMPVPVEMLRDHGVPEAEGAGVTTWWEYDQGELRLTVEPAVEVPAEEADNDAVAQPPPVDLFGTPWGEVLGDEGVAYAVARLAQPRHSIRRPRVPIQIEE